MQAVKGDDNTVTGYKGTLNIYKAGGSNEVRGTVEVTLTIATTENPED